MKQLVFCILLACTLTACGGDPAASQPAKPETTTTKPETAKTDAAPAKKAEAAHPWAGFNVGSFAKTKSTVVTQVAGKPFTTTSTITYTLLEKTADKAIVEMETEVMGSKTKTKTEIPLSGTGGAVAGGATPAGTAAPTPKGEGSEDLTVGGKTVHCKWMEIETSAAGNNVSSKVWTSSEVPGSMVKSQSKTTGAASSEATVELVDFGVK
ncbi:MAG: hypothetical protein K1Y36_20185 [Blastocatellia bacterium]|nr:hypothetical protein [Blastocatellia bacterium]